MLFQVTQALSSKIFKGEYFKMPHGDFPIKDTRNSHRNTYKDQ